jgi:hypothetical protein
MPVGALSRETVVMVPRQPFAGIDVRPLAPLRLELEVVWREPVRPAVHRLVGFLVKSARGPHIVIEAPCDPGGPAGTGPVRA